MADTNAPFTPTEPFSPVADTNTPFTPTEPFKPVTDTTAPFAPAEPFRPVADTTAPFTPTEPFSPAMQPVPPVQHQAPALSVVEMYYDVVIIGAGPAGLSTAIRLKQIARENTCDISICIVEKGDEVGSHIMSGAVLEPRALNELLPNWQALDAPLDCPAKKDRFLFLTKNKAFKMPTPPQMHNKGNYIISLGKFCKWLAIQAQNLGVEIYTGISADTILYDKNNRIIGIATGHMGINKDHTHSPQYTPGMHLKATYTVFGEGCRGSLSEDLIKKFNLRQTADPQTYGIGLKEVWEIDPNNAKPGDITHTIGWPMDTKTYGGSFLYHLNDNMVSIGFVVGLDYQNPHLSPYMEFQRFKHHPAIKKVLTGGRRISYGARALNEGGYQSIPNTAFPGGVMVGCSAGFLNVPKIKGTHTAMKSGMIAGESIGNAIVNTTCPAVLESYTKALKKSWIYDELYRVRNIRPAFHKGIFAGLLYGAIDTYILRGHAPWTFKNHADHTQLKPAHKCKKIQYPKPDGCISFDRLTNVAFSNTYHSENQPIHLQLQDDSVPIHINLAQYDAPEQRYCPAGVYEIVQQGTEQVLQINAQNCLHCKTCDIKDPYTKYQMDLSRGSGWPTIFKYVILRPIINRRNSCQVPTNYLNKGFVIRVR